MESRRKKFETWIIGQFGKDKERLLAMVRGAYVDDDINTMWIAFNAGIESQSW